MSRQKRVSPSLRLCPNAVEISQLRERLATRLIPHAIPGSNRYWAFLLCLTFILSSCGSSSITTTTLTTAAAAEAKNSLTVYKQRAQKRELLKPDARFILALTYVDNLLEKMDGQNPNFVWNGKTWSVNFRQIELGSLSECPTAEELFSVVKTYVAKQREFFSDMQYGPDAEKEFPISPGAAMTVLSDSKDNWHHRRKNLVLGRRWCRGAVALNQSCFDLGGIADEMSAQAIALTAVLDVMDKDAELEKFLLFNSLGYPRAADKYSASATTVQRSAGNHSNLRRYLDARSAALVDNEDTFLKLVLTRESPEQDLLIPLTSLHLRYSPNSHASECASTLMSAILNELDHQGRLTFMPRRADFDWSTTAKEGIAEWSLGDLGADFQDRLNKFHLRKKGKNFEEVESKKYYSALFLSAASILGASFIERSDYSSANLLIGSLKANTSNVDSLRAAKWIQAMLNIALRDHESRALSERALRPDQLSLQLFQFSGTATSSREPDQIRRLFVSLLPFLDTRPPYRRALAYIFAGMMLDYESYSKTVAAIDRDGAGSVWGDCELAALKSDRNALEQLCKSTDRGSLSLKVESLITLSELPNNLVGSSRTLSQLVPSIGDWRIAKSIFPIIEAGLGTAYGERDLAQWAAKHKPTDPIDTTELLSMWASLLVKEGKVNEAAGKLAEAPRRDVLPFVYARTEVLESQKHSAEAESWLLEIIKHYPNLFEPRLKAAQLYWQRDDFKKATEILGTRPGGYSRDEWNLSLSAALIELGVHSPERLKNALQSIDKLGVAPAEFLQTIIGRLAETGHLELALSISQWRDKKLPWQASVQSYLLLKNLKKAEASRTCYARLLASKYPAEIAEQAFRQKAFDVLSNLEATGNDECRLQLLKAAANAADTSATKAITSGSNAVRSCSSSDIELINFLHGRPHANLTTQLFEPSEAGRDSYYMSSPAKVSLDTKFDYWKMAMQLCDDHVIERKWAQEDLISNISRKEPLLWGRSR